MSKTRVYELAKELGLENKAVLDLCEQVGIERRASHSSSLSDDEAEKIRRFVIRRAVNDKGPSVREVSKEGQVLTESRLGGNVIRRRKRDDELESPAPVTPDKTIDLNSVPSSSGFASLVPDPQAERASRAAALREADALFAPKKPKAEEPPAAKEGAAKEEEKPAPEVVTAPVEAQPVEALQVEPVLSEDAEVTAEEENTDTPSITELEVEKLAEQSAAAAATDEIRRRHDVRAPKILGRIELPIKTVVERKPAAANGAAKTQAGADSEEESSSSRKRKKDKGTVHVEAEAEGAGKRPKKKQVLMKRDLLDYEGERDGWRGKKVKKKKADEGDERDGVETAVAKTKKTIKIPGHISVGELAKQMSMKVGEVMSVLIKLGVMAGINQLIDYDTASIIAGEFGHTTQNTGLDVEEVVLGLDQADAPESLKLRPPVVTVMGHVDHGKTSLLDAIRKTSVTKGEFGGITQHIGAYNVVLPNGGSVTFLDTPGHEAFTAMRSRGAKVTDIVVLVVAADDGVMPQTIEAINHAKAAGVPIIVAVNKIDKEGANRDRVLSQLGEHGLIPEEWGGQTIVCNVSALTKQGIDSLLENLYLQAEVLELKANPDRLAKGTIIESRVDRGRGTVISVLVQSGTLKKGDVFVCGAVFGRVRALIADDGSRVDSAGPSIPVEVLGAQSAPLSGDDFLVLESENQAREIAEQRQQIKRVKELAGVDGGKSAAGGLTLERFSQMVTDSTEVKELPLIIKADVQGSVEAVSESLSQLSNDEVRVRIVHKGVGAISENDVQLAAAGNAILIGFNVRPDARAQQLIDSQGLQVLYSRVIYDLVDLVQKAVKGLAAPVFKEKALGKVEVRQTFKVPRLGVVAGSYVLDGIVPRGAQVRLVRDSKVIYEGKMSSLRRFKDDVKEVQAGYECGIGIEGYSDIKQGDMIEVYKVEQVPIL